MYMFVYRDAEIQKIKQKNSEESSFQLDLTCKNKKKALLLIIK